MRRKCVKKSGMNPLLIEKLQGYGKILFFVGIPSEDEIKGKADVHLSQNSYNFWKAVYPSGLFFHLVQGFLLDAFDANIYVKETALLGQGHEFRVQHAVSRPDEPGLPQCV